MPLVPVSSSDSIDEGYSLSKNYRELEYHLGAQFWPRDIQHSVAILQDQGESLIERLGGWQLRFICGGFTQETPTWCSGKGPLANIRPNDRLVASGIYSFEMTDATHIKWCYNSGDYSDPVEVVADGESWNYDVGGSGFDLVVRSDNEAGDSCAIMASPALRLAGGEVDTDVGADAATIRKGLWALFGRYFELPEENLTDLSSQDIAYIEVTQEEVEYPDDLDLAHRRPDGLYDTNAPSAWKISLDIKVVTIESLPDDTANTRIIPLVVFEVDAGNVTAYPICPEPVNVALTERESAADWANQTPTVPTGLTVNSFAEVVTSTDVVEAVSPRCVLSFTCDENPENDLSYYIFRVEENVTTAPPGGTTENRVVYYYIPAVGGENPEGVLYGIPTHTDFKIKVAVVDARGRRSDWSDVVLHTVGETTVLTDTLDFTLEKTEDGFKIAGIGYDTNQLSKSLGFSVYVREGESPGANDRYFHSHWLFRGGLDEERDVYINWDGAHPYVEIRPFDVQGVYHTSTEDDINLSISEIDRAGVAPAPTFNASRLEEYSGFMLSGFTVEEEADSIDIEVWYGGVAPTAPEEVAFVANVPANISGFRIPWPMDDSGAEISIWGVDEFGVRQTNRGSETLDMTDCLILDGDPGPSFDVDPAFNMQGIRISNIADFPTKTAGIYVRVNFDFGAATNFDHVESYYDLAALEGPGSTGDIFLSTPACESVTVYMKAYDAFGRLQNGETSHSVSTLDYGTKVYTLSKNSGPEYTINQMIQEIHDDNPGRATLIIKEGEYSESVSFPTGFDTKLDIVGKGKVRIVGTLELKNAPWRSGGTYEAFTRPLDYWSLRFINLNFKGQVKRSPDGQAGFAQDVLFKDCTIIDSDSEVAPLKLEHSKVEDGGYFNILFINCHILATEFQNRVVIFPTHGSDTDVSFLFVGCTIIGLDLDYALIEVTGERSEELGPLGCIRCNLQAVETAAPGGPTCFLYVNSGDPVTYEFLLTSCTYYNSMDALLGGTNPALEIGDQNTNTEIPYPFLSAAME